MKKRLILAAVAVFALTGASVVQARGNINWSISVGDPFIGAEISNAPVYRYAPPVYVEPQVYVEPPVFYAPPPRVVYQQPYVVAPYGYVPYGYFQPGRDRWDHRRYEERASYDHHNWHDRHDHHDWRDGDRHDRDDRGRRDDRWQRR